MTTCIEYTIYNIQYTIYNIQYTIYNMQYSIFNIKDTVLVYNIQYKIFNIRYAHIYLSSSYLEPGTNFTALEWCGARKRRRKLKLPGQGKEIILLG